MQIVNDKTKLTSPNEATVVIEGDYAELDAPAARNLAIETAMKLGLSKPGIKHTTGPLTVMSDGTIVETTEDMKKLREEQLLQGKQHKLRYRNEFTLLHAGI